MPSYARRLTRLAIACLLGATATAAGADAALAQTAGSHSPGGLPAAGAPAQPTKYKRISPTFGLLQTTLAQYGRQAAIFGPGGAPDDVTMRSVAASLRFARPLHPTEVAAMEADGVDFLRREGRLVRVGTVYLAQVDWQALERLADDARLVRAEPTWSPRIVSPLEETSRMVGAEQARMLPEFGVDGSGVVVGDLDSGFDVLHPHFFRADAGYYEWLDVDGNGMFNPGRDAVDLDGDGQPGDAERLHTLDGSTVEANWQNPQNSDGVVQTDLDWIYADTNGDGERNVGVDDGFTESDPAYGEPLFVADDVDKDGMLELGEKIVRLGTSKYREVHVGRTVYTRGIDLIESAAGAALENSFHGTSVASIVAGGQPGFHTRVGLAPGAELIGYGWDYERRDDQQGFGQQIEAVEDAIDNGEVDILLHEWTDLYSTATDGSSNLEAAMDSARQAGIVQVNPVGNLNLARKHAERPIERGSPVELTFNVGEGYQAYGRTYPYTVVLGALWWRTDQEPTVTLVAPDGTEVVLDTASQSGQPVGNDTIQAALDISPRNTRHLSFYVWSQDYQRESVQQGDWTIRLDGWTAPDTLRARVGDYYSSWGPGVGWTEPTADVGTAVFPSSADSAFGVAAFGGRHASQADGSRPGQLRGYSGRGPRIDGAPIVDIAAPDDPFAAMAGVPQYIEYGMGRSWFSTFGGTSGAGPHVAAAIALLKEQNPQWGPDELESEIVTSAQKDALVPDMGALPNAYWGSGKVDVWQALHGIPRAGDNRRPQADAQVRPLASWVVFDASASSDPDGDELQYRFDYDYDGVFDTDWQQNMQSQATRSFFDGPGLYVGRVEVRDDKGLRHGRLMGFELTDDPPQPDAGGPGDSVDAGTPGAGGDDAGHTGAGQSGGTDSGCACATNRPAAPALAWPLLVMGLGLLGLRRRRPRR